MTHMSHDFVEPAPSNESLTILGGIQPRSMMIYHTVHAGIEMTHPKNGVTVNIRWRGEGHQYKIDAAAVFNAADPCKYLRDAIVQLCQTEDAKTPLCVANLAGDTYHINSEWYEIIKHATLGGSGSTTLDRIVFSTFAPWSRVAMEYYASRIESDHRIGVLTQLLMTLSAEALLIMVGNHTPAGRMVFKIPEIHHKFCSNVTPHNLSSYTRLCVRYNIEPIVKTVDDLRMTPAYLGWNDEDRTLGERVMLAYNHRLRML